MISMLPLVLYYRLWFQRYGDVSPQQGVRVHCRYRRARSSRFDVCSRIIGMPDYFSYLTIRAIPKNYKVLFLSAGAVGQFSAVPLNLGCIGDDKTADYINSGQWSDRAIKEVCLSSYLYLIIRLRTSARLT